MTGGAEHKNHEQRLVTFVEGLSPDASDGVGVHLRLSSLQPEHRQPFHTRLVLEYLQPFVERHTGDIYQIFSGDLVLVMRAMDDAAAEKMCQGLRSLFAADPLTEAARASEIGSLSDRFQIKDALSDFKQLADRLVSDAKADRAASEDGPAPPPQEPIDARHVPQVVNALGGADLGEMVQRQSICAVVGGNPPQPVMSELSIDFERLSAQLLPNVNIGANRWYRRALEDLVLERLLAWLAKETISDGMDTVTVDVTLASLMSDTFLEFDRAAAEPWRKRVILELQEIDLFADLGAALFLSDYLHGRGYRVSVDGVNHLTLPLIDRERLGFDFVKLRWGPDYQSDIVSDRRKALADAIERIGQARVILYDCQSARAVSAGQGLGISLFQGPYIESLLRFADKPKTPGKTKKQATADT